MPVLKVEVGGAVPCYYLLSARRTIGVVGGKAETLGHAHIEAKGRIAAKVALAIEMMIKVFKGRKLGNPILAWRNNSQEAR